MTPRSIADDIRDALPTLDADADTKAAIESWLLADKEFNVWFLETTKGALADDDLMNLLAGYGDSQETVTSAWTAFRHDSDATKLRTGVTLSIARMQALMTK
jgi:hypothetical protein